MIALVFKDWVISQIMYADQMIRPPNITSASHGDKLPLYQTISSRNIILQASINQFSQPITASQHRPCLNMSVSASDFYLLDFHLLRQSLNDRLFWQLLWLAILIEVATLRWYLWQTYAVKHLNTLHSAQVNCSHCKCCSFDYWG